MLYYYTFSGLSRRERRFDPLKSIIRRPAPDIVTAGYPARIRRADHEIQDAAPANEKTNHVNHNCFQ
jgi:hypothetical protein